ncbi:MAG: hypothetical protein ACO1PW_00090, partial [Actinomycetota bacterium]
QAHQTARRLAEAARLGFRQAIVPASAPATAPGIQVLRAATLAEAVDLAGLLSSTGTVIDVDEAPSGPAAAAPDGPPAVEAGRGLQLIR